MFCRFCGSEIPDEAFICPHCREILTYEEEGSLESSPLDSSLQPDLKLYLEGDAETLFLHPEKRTKFYIIVENLSSVPLLGVEVKLSDLPEVELLIKSQKIPRLETKNQIYFTILAREPGFFTLTATLTSSSRNPIEFPIDIQVESIKSVPEAPISLYEHERKAPLENEAQVLEKEVEKALIAFFNKKAGSAFSTNALKNRLYLIVLDLEARAYGAEHLQRILYHMVQKGVITSSVRDNETHYHILNNKEPSKPIKIREDFNKPLVKVPKSKSTISGGTIALIVFGFIGGILLLSGITQIYNNFQSGFTWSSLPTGLTLSIIGFIILTIVIGIKTNGECCWDCFCDDCLCDC